MWQRLRNVFRRSQVDEAFFSELEGTLLAADVGPELTRTWLREARRWKTAEEVRRTLRAAMLGVFAGDAGRPPAGETWQARTQDGTAMRLRPSSERPEEADVHRPSVIMIVGVNGVGKTTTIAKLAHRYRQRGRTPLLVAGDTFRAAAIAQLQVWAGRIGCPLIARQQGSDAAAVAFDGVMAGVARAADVVIVDTAGRLHTKSPLREELKKAQRVMGKALPGAPHETWCILDAMIGQNAGAQVREFHAALTLTGLIVAKCDGTAKAGALFSIATVLPLPIHFVGTGEQVTDLSPFDPAAFVANILEPME